jgi:hypothetical protein
MVNPAYGFATNEDYSLRFANLLGRDGFEGSLREEIQGIRDKEALTSNGWLWLMRWARSRQIAMQEDLLLELFEEWSSVPARCAIVDLATYGFEPQTRSAATVSDFPNRFLARIMNRATEIKREDLQGDDRSRPELGRLTARAESVMVVLIQVGTPLTLMAASALVRHQWQGREQLLEFLRALAGTLDRETRDVWSEQLDFGLSRE